MYAAIALLFGNMLYDLFSRNSHNFIALLKISQNADEEEGAGVEWVGEGIRAGENCKVYYLFVFHGFLRFKSTRDCPFSLLVRAAFDRVLEGDNSCLVVLCGVRSVVGHGALCSGERGAGPESRPTEAGVWLLVVTVCADQHRPSFSGSSSSSSRNYTHYSHSSIEHISYMHIHTYTHARSHICARRLLHIGGVV